jgi:hypothetical protein
VYSDPRAKDSSKRVKKMRWTVAKLYRTAPLMIGKGETSEIVRALKRRLYSNDVSYLLKRDLTVPFESPIAKIPFYVRPLQKADLPKIIEERPTRLPALEAGISTGYVGVTPEGDICYMQWLIDSSQNELIHRSFRGLSPRLNHDEALLEWAYTFKKYRGLSIMACAMSQISERAVDFGARWILTFVDHNNVFSLKGCKKAGFVPSMMRYEGWRGFRFHQSVEPLPKGTSYPS